MNKILNLGCGSKTASDAIVTNIDWSIFLRIKRNPLLRIFAPLFIRGERLTRFNLIPENIVVHNLSKGIPFEDSSVDVVYHSHLLEHLDREIAKKFLTEVRRVLKPRGVARIVVPDFEILCRSYVDHCKICDGNADEILSHERFIAEILEQSVRREASGTSRQNPLSRYVENFILGDARKRGETHQWMYDRVSLKSLLLELGFTEVHQQGFNTSLIENWNRYGLDLDGNGNQYKPRSLYIEAVK